METDIIEGNKLIGEFMGKKFKDPLNYMYDTSWDWIMPVVEKIEKLGLVVEISNGYYLKNILNAMFYKCNLFTYKEKEIVLYGECYSSSSRIDSVWLAIVSFIKWYKNNTFEFEK